MCIRWGPALNNSQFSWFCKLITDSVSWDLTWRVRSRKTEKSKQRKLKFDVKSQKILNKIVRIFLFKVESDLWNFRIVKTQRTKWKKAARSGGKLDHRLRRFKFNMKSEGKKSILIRLFFRLYFERISYLSVFFPSSTFHGPFIYIFLLLSLFFLVHFDVPFR